MDSPPAVGLHPGDAEVKVAADGLRSRYAALEGTDIIAHNGSVTDYPHLARKPSRKEIHN